MCGRLDISQQAESEWRKQRAKEKDKQAKLAQALKTFPKLNNPSNLPTQLQNFSKVLDSCGIDDVNKASKLPEILTGQLAVILRNVDLPEEIPFEEAKSKLLRAAGLTPLSAAKNFMRPDTEHLSKMSCIDLTTMSLA